MAVTISLYNHTPKLFANGEVDLTALKLMLLTNSATFTAANTAVSSVSTNQVSGNGWASGGEDLDNAAVTIVNTNEAKLDADDIEATATGGSIGPAHKGVIYDSDSNNLIAFIDYDGAQEAGVGTDFKVVWHSDGIISWTIPA